MRYTVTVKSERPGQPPVICRYRVEAATGGEAVSRALCRPGETVDKVEGPHE